MVKATPARRSILCVDDYEKDRELLRPVLGSFDVTFTRNADEALRAFNAGAFDAYVLEYWLTDWTGHALCRELRKSDPNAPVIFYTRAAAEPYRGKVMRAGATAFLEKSEIEPAVLVGYLDNLLRTADMANLAARVAMERAMADEIERRMADAPAAMTREKLLTNSALARSLREKMMRTFFERQGTKAYFDRTWPHLLASARAEALTVDGEASPQSA